MTDTALSKYIADYLLPRWRAARRPHDERCERNRNLFFGLSDNSWKRGEATGWRSKTVIRKVREKVLSAVALLHDMLVRAGRIHFVLEPSGYLAELLESADPEMLTRIRQNTEVMTELIHEQLARCDAERTLALQLISCALYGEAYGKWRLKRYRERRYVPLVPPGLSESMAGRALPPEAVPWAPAIVERWAPWWDYVSRWDIFRDPEADSLQEGDGVIQRQRLSPAKLWEFASSGAFFLPRRVERVVERVVQIEQNIAAGQTYLAASDVRSEPLDTLSVSPAVRDRTMLSRCVTVWECWLSVPRRVAEETEKELIEESGLSLEDFMVPPLEGSPNEHGRRELERDVENVDVMCWLAGPDYTLVRYARIPATERPFCRVVWEQLPDEPHPTSLADSVADLQEALTGAFRALEDNKRLATTPLVGVKEHLLVNPKDIKEMTPGMILRLRAACRDIREALQVWAIPDVSPALMDFIMLADRYADDASMIPRIAQGYANLQQATAYERAVQVEYANRYIANVMRNLDGLVEYLVRRFYDWNMLDSTLLIPRGDYRIIPRGSMFYQVKVLRAEKLRQLLQVLMATPAVASRFNLGKLVEDIVVALDLDPDDYLKSAEELQAEQQAPEVQLQMRRAAVELEKARAQAEKLAAEARAIQERARTEKAKLLVEARARGGLEAARELRDLTSPELARREPEAGATSEA